MPEKSEPKTDESLPDPQELRPDVLARQVADALFTNEAGDKAIGIHLLSRRSNMNFGDGTVQHPTEPTVIGMHSYDSAVFLIEKALHDALTGPEHP